MAVKRAKVVKADFNEAVIFSNDDSYRYNGIVRRNSQIHERKEIIDLTVQTDSTDCWRIVNQLALAMFFDNRIELDAASGNHKVAALKLVKDFIKNLGPQISVELDKKSR